MHYIYFLKKLFQSTRLYIKRMMGGRQASLCLVKSGNVLVFMKFLIRRDEFCHDNSIGSRIWLMEAPIKDLNTGTR